MRHFKTVAFIALICVSIQSFGQKNGYFLIAHRGGVVNEHLEENSADAIRQAAKKGYWMVELDVRLTKDSVLIAHHDRDFNRYYHVNETVSDTDWKTIRFFRSAQGNKVQKLADLLKLCEKLGLQVMIDNKIQGFHPHVFNRLLDLLAKNNLSDQALMIGTKESTGFFRGKIKLSCTKEQILENMERPGYSPDHYYLFGNPSKGDFEWALEHDIQVVGVINFRSKNPDEQHYEEIAVNLKSIGVKYIQLDSRFDKYFIQ